MYRANRLGHTIRGQVEAGVVPFFVPGGAPTVSESTRTLERALDILECFSHDEPILTLAQTAERVHLPKSTVYRLLATLENRRFIRREDGNGSYSLGIRLLELGSSVLKSKRISDHALPYMQRLSAKHRETVDLAIFDQSEVVYLEVIESPQRMRIAAAPGQRLPAICTATGKAFLAFMPDDRVRQVWQESTGNCGEHAKPSLDHLRKSLRSIRQRGYAVAAEEYEEGVNAVAAPILDEQRRPIAVIALVGPTIRLPSTRMRVLGKSVRNTADHIAQEIGLALA